MVTGPRPPGDLLPQSPGFTGHKHTALKVSCFPVLQRAQQNGNFQGTQLPTKLFLPVKAGTSFDVSPAPQQAATGVSCFPWTLVQPGDCAPTYQVLGTLDEPEDRDAGPQGLATSWIWRAGRGLESRAAF